MKSPRNFIRLQTDFLQAYDISILGGTVGENAFKTRPSQHCHIQGEHLHGLYRLLVKEICLRALGASTEQWVRLAILALEIGLPPSTEEINMKRTV